MHCSGNQAHLLKLAYYKFFYIILKGAFNNYLDQILPNFDHLPPLGGQSSTFYMVSMLCSHEKVWTFY